MSLVHGGSAVLVKRVYSATSLDGHRIGKKNAKCLITGGGGVVEES